MASNYPGGVDAFDTIASDKKTSDAVGGRTHRAMHNDLGDAIEAVQTELGTDPAGASATVKARFEVIEANDWVTSARIADGAVTAAKLAVQPGNLLTTNQAQPTTTGAYTLSNCTEGAAGVFTATDTSLFYVLSGSMAVTPGETVTAVSTLAPVGRTALVLVEFLTAGGSNVGGYLTGNTVAAGTTGQSRLTVVAPATAATFRVYACYTGAGSGGDTVTVTKAGAWKGTGGQFALPGVPILGLADAPIGNLLTANQALPTTTGGWSLDGVTESSAGFYNFSGTGIGKALSANPGIPVDASETYTFTANLSPTGRTCKVVLEFRTAGGANTGGWLSGNEIAAGQSGYSTVVAAAPSDAAYAICYVVYSGTGAASGDTVAVWRTGFWKGAGGQWAMPGTPIVHTGIRPNPANTAEVQIWNDATATWITV